MACVLVQNGRVVQVEASAENAFPVHPLLQWYNCTDGVEYGWTLEEGNFTSPPDAEGNQTTIAAGSVVNVGE